MIDRVVDQQSVVGAPEGMPDVGGEGGFVKKDGVADDPGGEDEGECEEVCGGGFEDGSDGLSVSMREMDEVGEVEGEKRVCEDQLAA